MKFTLWCFVVVLLTCLMLFVECVKPSKQFTIMDKGDDVLIGCNIDQPGDCKTFTNISDRLYSRLNIGDTITDPIF